MNIVLVLLFFFKQKTAYEMRISDWSSDVCSSDLEFKCIRSQRSSATTTKANLPMKSPRPCIASSVTAPPPARRARSSSRSNSNPPRAQRPPCCRSEEHTSELQSLMRISYAVFCLKKKKQIGKYTKSNTQYHR